MLTPQNGQTHSNNSSARADELFERVWPFCRVALKMLINDFYFVVSLWTISSFLFELFSQICKSALDRLQWRVCLQENVSYLELTFCRWTICRSILSTHFFISELVAEAPGLNEGKRLSNLLRNQEALN